ncbi:E3 ubiquitin protein ligase DRIP2 [Acorus calamus]|uniref:E3 ubiquitin protein ligase DRIP2 n=1 Tax=Acorus calamus TaxID=4465 RepID=A0AAV9EDW2_ACOCL|nr:E3 ubiquitin protein ligase DRIP2 [Acorus calamus]
MTVLGSSSSAASEQPRRLAAPSEVAADWVLRRRPRPHVGIWFRLVASPNQSNEPYLPQINKSYLRIKDGRMTIRLLKKYLINKLELNNESEVDAQAALIEEMENLLDMTETLVVEKELRVMRSLLELSVWGSLSDLVAALANGGEEDDSD